MDYLTLIEVVKELGAKTDQDIVDALQDGEFLCRMNVDTETVEDAYWYVKSAASQQNSCV